MLSKTFQLQARVEGMKEAVRGLRRILVAGLAAVLIPTAVQAHVSVWPRQSNQNATEKYEIRVPNEEKVAATSLELQIPDGTEVEAVQAPAGTKYQVKRQGQRIVAITWEMNVQPGEFVIVAFIARNGSEKTQLIWGMRQHFADGKSTDWTNGPNGLYANTAVTKLAPGRNFIDLR